MLVLALVLRLGEFNISEEKIFLLFILSHLLAARMRMSHDMGQMAMICFNSSSF
jgi:hypothetical protein